MKCLILAAGRGSRLPGAADSKPLVTVAGLPLIERTIATARRAGFSDFYVVTGHNAPTLEAFSPAMSCSKSPNHWKYNSKRAPPRAACAIKRLCSSP